MDDLPLDVASNELGAFQDDGVVVLPDASIELDLSRHRLLEAGEPSHQLEQPLRPDASAEDGRLDRHLPVIHSDESLGESRASPRKRRRSKPPAMDPKPTSKPIVGDDSDKNCCCICLEQWTNSGEHRMVCLPCGHLLGDSCAKSWLKLQKKCPICKTKASYKHVRIIYGAPTELLVVEAPELDAIRQDLLEQKQEFKSLKKKYDALKAAKQRLKEQLVRYEERDKLARAQPGVALGSKRPRTLAGGLFAPANRPSSAEALRNQNVGAILSEHFVCATSGRASALAFDPAGSLLFSEAGSAPSTVCLRRVPLVTPDLIIRSVPFPAARVTCLGVCSLAESYRGYIAAGCSDRILRVLDANLHIATAYTLPAGPTSCSWLSTHPSVVLVGLQNGQLAAFDVSSSSQNPLKISQLSAGRPASPAVHSLVSLTSPRFPDGSVFAASLRCVAVVSFRETTGFTMDVEQVQGFEDCAAASAFEDVLALSSRQSTAGSHSLYTGFARAQNADVASAASARDVRARVPLSLGPLALHSPIRGYTALLPFQRSALVRLRSGNLFMASNDGNGTRIWMSNSSSSVSGEHWETQQLEHDHVSGPVRAVSAMRPPRQSGQSPVLAVLYEGKLCLYLIHAP